MPKYHKDLGFKTQDAQAARQLCERMRPWPYVFAKHALGELLQERDAVNIGRTIRDYKLNFADVFELVTDGGRIQKLGFRIPYTERDIVFMLSIEKMIITCWTNARSDGHATLDVRQYATI